MTSSRHFSLAYLSPRLAAVTAIVLVAVGCGKGKGGRTGQSGDPPPIAPGQELDLASDPTIIFQVFGETGDARMIPVAAMVNYKLRPILLTPANWQKFDAKYLRGGKSYYLFQDGTTVGSVDVKQGMWERPGQTIYSLPGCKTLVPIAAVQVKTDHAHSGFTLEYLASNGTLGKDRPTEVMTQAEITKIAREMGAQVAKGAGVPLSVLDSLDFNAAAFASGATRALTIVASFIDPSAENSTAKGAHTTQVLLVANKDSTGAWHPSFSHVVNGPLATAAFRRYFGHLDVTGDAVDEIILEGWQFGGDTFMIVLGWKDGKWSDVFRARSSWCLDEHAPS